ncbi:MAG: hypothetical protein KUG79_01470 [Pseudomonadales bacterium]|nr:hypothetical protein [Pseudomonadales bacterium]
MQIILKAYKRLCNGCAQIGRSYAGKLAKKTVTDSRLDNLVRFVQLAQQDQSMGAWLKALLALSTTERHDALDIMLKRMQMGGAPAEFVGLLVLLRDENIVLQARQIMRDN